MAGDADRIADDIRIDQVGQMHPLAAVVSERQVEHLVEVAVIDVAAVVDRHQVAAHDTVEIGVEVGSAQQRDVVVELAFGDQHRAEALDRHVG